MTNASSAKQILRAGVARVVITPPVGIRMLGYTVQEAGSQGIERELLATALVLADDTTQAVIIACDIVFIQNPHCDRIREHIGRRLGIPAANILINCSHTHLGPMLPGWQRQSDEEEQMQQRYVAFLQEALAGVAAMAQKNLQPARLGSAKGTAPLGINRREKLPDGTVIIGENPNGPIDRTVDVIRIDDLSGRPTATISSAACHTVVLGPKTLVLSPDFIGPARQIIESATNAPSLFLQGAAGNINPACGIGSGGPDQFDDSLRMGAMLGGETLKVWGQIRTHHRHGPRRVVKSVAAISVWDYEPLPAETVSCFGVTRQRLIMPLAPMPSREQADRQLAEYRAKYEETLKSGSTQGAKNVAQRMFQWAELVAGHVARGEMQVTREIEIWAMRLNDLAIATVSAEPLAELGLEVKQRSPIAHTLFLGYSNGCIGYIPPPSAFAEGGMEVVESHYNYLLPAKLTPEWAPKVVETSLDLLKQLS